MCSSDRAPRSSDRPNLWGGGLFYNFYSYLEPLGHNHHLSNFDPPHSAPVLLPEQNSMSLPLERQTENESVANLSLPQDQATSPYGTCIYNS